MSWLKMHYPQVREVLDDAIPQNWPGLRHAAGALLKSPMMIEATLPLAACRAVGGDPLLAVPVTAALLALANALRIYDDLVDRDRPGQLWERVGPERAMNYANVLYTISFAILNDAALPYERLRKINRLFTDSCLTLFGGQDRDINGATNSIENYFVTIEMKTGCPYALACASGAMVGTENPEIIHACYSFGHHLGLTIQILNDFESIWQPDGKTDLQNGKVTLPLIYGMSRDHTEKDELIELVTQKRVDTNEDRIRAILDHIDTKDFLIWSALKEREEAIQSLAVCPDAEGKRALVSYITGLFGDLDDLMNAEYPSDRPPGSLA